jgi:hypothetical protein
MIRWRHNMNEDPNPVGGQADHLRTTRRRRNVVPETATHPVDARGVPSAGQADRGKNRPVLPSARRRLTPTNDALLRALFERRAPELSASVRDILASTSDPGSQLKRLVTLQAAAAIQFRRYIPFFFGHQMLPPDVSIRWRKWNRQFEKEWAGVVSACMDAGYLDKSDALVTTRLILGMTISAVQRCEPVEDVSAHQVADSVLVLLRIDDLA